MKQSIIKKIHIDDSRRFSKNHTLFTVCYYSGKTATYNECDLPKTAYNFLAARKDKREKMFTQEWPIFESKKSYNIVGVLKEFVVVD